MFSGWINLILSSLCSVAIVHFLKLSEVKNLRTVQTLTVNYLIGGVLALFQAKGDIIPDLNVSVLSIFIFTTIVGVIFIVNFLVYSKSVHSNGMGVSVTSMRLSLLVPVLTSILIYDEHLSLLKLIGLILVFVSMALLIPKKKNIKFRHLNAIWLLVILFLLSGLADTSLKVYEEQFSSLISEFHFMGFIFFMAFFIGLLVGIFRKGPIIRVREVGVGTLIGIPNLYSSVFLIYALQQIDGSIAYPTVNILNVLGGTLLGVWFWKDIVTKSQWVGITVAIIAIIILL